MNKTNQLFKATPREGGFGEQLAQLAKVSFEAAGDKTNSFKPDATSGSGK